VLLLLLILALNKVKHRKILENLGQLVGRVDVNRAAKSTRRKVLPLGLLRLVTINCRSIPEDNNEVKKVLGKKTDEKRFLRLVCLEQKYSLRGLEIKMKNWPKGKKNQI